MLYILHVIYISYIQYHIQHIRYYILCIIHRTLNFLGTQAPSTKRCLSSAAWPWPLGSGSRRSRSPGPDRVPATEGGRAHIPTYTCTYVIYMYICKHICPCMHLYLNTHTSTYTYLYIYVSTCMGCGVSRAHESAESGVSREKGKA